MLERGRFELKLSLALEYSFVLYSSQFLSTLQARLPEKHLKQFIPIRISIHVSLSYSTHFILLSSIVILPTYLSLYILQEVHGWRIDRKKWKRFITSYWCHSMCTKTHTHTQTLWHSSRCSLQLSISVHFEMPKTEIRAKHSAERCVLCGYSWVHSVAKTYQCVLGFVYVVRCLRRLL